MSRKKLATIFKKITFVSFDGKYIINNSRSLMPIQTTKRNSQSSVSSEQVNPSGYWMVE